VRRKKMDKKAFKFRRNVTLVTVGLFVVMLLIGVPSLTHVIAEPAATATTPGSSTPVDSAATQAKASVTMFGLIAAAVAFGFGAIGAGMAIANVGAAAMGAIGEKPEVGGQALIFIALAEGIVVFGFITALMIIGKV
jgi:V/A-type H+-transporting ATPase subunit K